MLVHIMEHAMAKVICYFFEFLFANDALEFIDGQFLLPVNLSMAIETELRSEYLSTFRTFLVPF